MKPILVFSYHDPKSIYTESLINNLPLLKKVFSNIIISVTKSTLANQPETIDTLDKLGCVVIKNDNDHAYGNHYRQAISEALKKSEKSGYIYFGYIDRILFALESGHKSQFLEDISKDYSEQFVLFSRSEKAWESHPREYYVLENIVSEAGGVFFGKKNDWLWCGALMQRKMGERIVNESKEYGLSVLAEFILIALRSEASFKNIFVDWLAWEDPHWYKEKDANNKLSDVEKNHRLQYCVDSLKLFLK